MKICRTSLLPLKKLLDSVDGKMISEKDANDFCFTNVQTDSRNVVDDSLFVPLVGENQDGHKYVPSGAEKGASVIFINNAEYEKNPDIYDGLSKKYEKLFIIKVENTLKALQDAAESYVSQFTSLIKIGITGSSGKTTTKEIIVSILKEKFNVVYTQGNFNSETGLPLSVFNIRKENEVGVFEMGMNRKHEMQEISKVLKPNYAIITNIGTAHIGKLGSRKEIAEEKRHIFDFVEENGAAFIPFSDDFRDFLGENVKGEKIYYGPDVPENISGIKFIKDSGISGTIFSFYGTEINLKIPGKYNYSDALGAIAVAETLGLSAKEIKTGIEKLSGVPGRMEILKIKTKCGHKITLLKDCYNANPDSMESALGFMKTVSLVNRKIVVLGDMLELGNESRFSHEKIGEEVFSLSPDFAFFVGDEMKYAFKKAESLGLKNAFYVEKYDDESIKKISESLNKILLENDLVLLKASRGISLERIIPLIQENTDSESKGAMNK